MSESTTPERDPLRTTFHTLHIALECTREAAPLIKRFKRSSHEIGTQLERGLIRTCLGIGEANKREGGNRTLWFREARGRANEALTALMAAEALGLASGISSSRLARKLDKLVAYLGKLSR